MKNNPENLYPQAFLTGMQALLGEEYTAFRQSLDTPAPTSVRLNPQKASDAFTGEEVIPWCNDGRYLAERPSFTFDPLFHAGVYYVQEASSMFLEEVWKRINPENVSLRVLDLCAAPGGKSTHLLSLMSADSLLVSNELIPGRNKILQQNVIKWGNANCIVTQNKPEDFVALGEYFDVIVLDAPCSGEGLFRKDKDAIAEWSEKNVNMCALRQKDILGQAILALKPGGYLVYSTCTFEPDENDNNITRLLRQGFSLINLEADKKYSGINQTRAGWQFYPHKIKGEGFFIAVVQKDWSGGNNLFGVNSSAPVKRKESPVLDLWLTKPALFTELIRNNITFALPLSISNDFERLERKLYIRHAGTPLGEWKGKDFLPSAALALSNFMGKDKVAVAFNYEEAISYLRCESPPVKTGEKGWFLAQYNGLNLGWVKSLGNRVNNYFPKEWRILKQL